MLTASQIESAVLVMGDAGIASHCQRYFKTAKGEYGEGDVFIGIRVPNLRKLVPKYKTIELNELDTLLQSQYHEIRLLALFILVKKYQLAKTESEQQALVDFYIQRLKWVNNWDLVDSSAHHILGHYLLNRDKGLLFDFARSEHLWTRRAAMIATLTFIKHHDFEPTLTLSDMLINDPEDLIHKACGWMIREIFRHDRQVLDTYLKKHYQQMPRTMLRYAIEKHEPEVRKMYLSGTI
ncbi:DNA alkylation repair protein [Thalassotalea mangrovi]|uniref:DNA alkylation repair protein n=1 Tax=Thalassotalea mangrovi TaxID=2572245 RepID=A0A4U1B1M6_9GAMM|nr:DNA alkylation repair protein [Thalassotalea mangrovi]TKB43040.1 DNA alkylation repair protein [Thalassotalea mangrovi]